MPDQPNAADLFHDQIVTHQINILRVAADQRAGVLKTLEKLEGHLAIEIQQATDNGKSALTIGRMKALKTQTTATIQDAYSKIAKTQDKSLGGIALLEAKHTAATINSIVKVPLATVAMSPEQATALAGKTLIHGKFSRQFWEKQGADLAGKFEDQMRIGMALGEGVDKLVARVRGSKANNYADGIMIASKRQAETLVRTAAIAVSNEARIESFKRNGDLVKGIQWMATLDSRTTPICQALDGKQWRMPNFEPVQHDKDFPGPIAHWNCRSTQIAVLRSWKELAGDKALLKDFDIPNLDDALKEKLLASGMSVDQAKHAAMNVRESLDGNQAKDLTFEDWLRKKPEDFQDRVLGEQRAHLWRAGKFTVTEMTDQNNRPLTLAELHQLVTGEPPSKEFLNDFAPLDVKPEPFVDTVALAAAQAEAQAQAAAAKAAQEAQAAAEKAAAEAQAAKEAAEAQAAAEKAAKEKAEQEAKAAAEAQAAAEAEAKKQAQASETIAAVKANPEGKQLLAKAIKTLESEQPELKPSELLAAATEQAKAAQAKASNSAALSGYKKNVLAGKAPTPAQKAALATLPEVEQEAFLLKLNTQAAELKEAELAAAAAKAAKEKAEAEAAAAAAAAKKANEDAQAKIGEILSNPEGQQLKAKAIGKLMKEQPHLEPAELLAKAHEDAAMAQKKASDAAALSGAKKKLLKGEAATPAQQKVIDGMTPEQKDAWLKGIEAEKLKATAKDKAADAVQAAEDAGKAAQKASTLPSDFDEPAPPKLTTNGGEIYEQAKLKSDAETMAITKQKFLAQTGANIHDLTHDQAEILMAIESGGPGVGKFILKDKDGFISGAISIHDTGEGIDILAVGEVHPGAKAQALKIATKYAKMTGQGITVNVPDAQAPFWKNLGFEKEGINMHLPFQKVEAFSEALDAAIGGEVPSVAIPQPAVKLPPAPEPPAPKPAPGAKLTAKQDAALKVAGKLTKIGDLGPDSLHAQVLDMAEDDSNFDIINPIKLGTFEAPAEVIELNGDAAAFKKAVKQAVPIKDVMTMQPGLESKVLESYIKSGAIAGDQATNAAGIASHLPQAVKKDGKYYLMDGNHRVAAQMLLGEDTVEMQVVDLDAPAKPAAAPKAKKTPISKPIQEKPTAEPPPIAPVNASAFPKTPSDLKTVKALGGSTGAELRKADDGQLYVWKKGNNAGHVREELTADRAYAILGANVPEGVIYETADGPIKLTRYLGDDIQTLGSYIGESLENLKHAQKELRKHFVADALFANYDVAGASGDNILLAKKSGQFFRVDNGGSFRYRAQGALKDSFTKDVVEIDTMRNPKINPNAAKIFHGITDDEIKEQIQDVLKKKDELLASLPLEIRGTVEARIQNLAERYGVKEAADTATKTAGDFIAKNKKIGETVRAARLNGLSYLGDSGDVEDLQALFWENKTEAGTPVTRMQLKLTLQGAQRMVNTIGEAKFASAPLRAGAQTAAAAISNVHPQDTFWNSILSTAKTVSLHASDGQYNQSTLAIFEETKKKLAALLKDKSLDSQGNAMVAQYMKAVEAIEKAKAEKAMLPAGTLKQFTYTPPAPAAAKAQTGSVRIFKDDLVFKKSDLKNGNGTETAVLGAHPVDYDQSKPVKVYRIEVGEDVEIRFFRPSGSIEREEALAMQGSVDMRIKGSASPETLQRAYDVMKEFGIDLAPPTEEMQELIYLRKGVYMQEKALAPGFEAIFNGAGTEAQKVKEAKAWIKKKYGIQLPDKPTADYQPHGTVNTFGQGQRNWFRWDLPPSKIEKEMSEYGLYHRTGGELSETIDALLNSGGELTCTTNRLRKGVPLIRENGSQIGMSPYEDFHTGGASYVFTRIYEKTKSNTGIWFKIRNLARLDSHSHSGDVFGALNTIKDRLTTVNEFKTKLQSNNETDIKGALFLLDEIDFIKTDDLNQRQKVIAAFKKHGVTKLTDGRTIESIVK